MPAMANWLSEFKRRNGFQVGVAYFVVARVLIQIAETDAPQLNLPEWAPRLIALIVLLRVAGFDNTPEYNQRRVNPRCGNKYKECRLRSYCGGLAGSTVVPVVLPGQPLTLGQ